MYAVLLLPAVVITLLLIMLKKEQQANSLFCLRSALLKAVLLFFAILWAVTEILSCFDLIIFKSVMLVWSCILIGCGFYAIKKWQHQKVWASLQNALALHVPQAYRLIIRLESLEYSKI